MKAVDVKTAINGILLVNKSQGMTSHKVMQKAKRLLDAPKAGHTGSLDPMATGMLPICFGEATKICQFMLCSDKAYETTGLLGIKTNTSDATGELIAQVSDFHITEPQLQQVLEEYKGLSKQIPSMYSALKHNGMPLYFYARQGMEIERKPREILINQLDLISFDGRHFSLTVHCSKGTYIRNLVEDIGDALGVGAHVTRLHRTYTGGFANHRMYTLEELESMTIDERLDCLLPIDQPIGFMDPIVLTDAQILTLRQGRTVLMPTYYDGSEARINQEEIVRIYDNNQEFIGLGALNANGDLKVKRLLAFTQA